tara:strand:+ start:1175 stop:2179 length:1005 start_codon:yes stop_codon:yes gene_type:complete
MKLTTKQINKLIKEELDNLLNENQQSIEALAKKFLERTEREPEAWKQEYNQYLSMLRNKHYEELFILLEGEQVGHEIFAYMLVDLEEEMREIKWWVSAYRNFPNLFSLYKQFYLDKLNLVSSERAGELESIMEFVETASYESEAGDARRIREHEIWRLQGSDDIGDWYRDKEYFDGHYVNTLGWYKENIDYERDNFYTATDKFYQYINSILRYLISRVGLAYQMWAVLDTDEEVEELFERETGITFPFEFNGTKYDDLQETAWFILDLYILAGEDSPYQRDHDQYEYNQLVLQEITKKLGKTPPESEEDNYDNDGFGGFYYLVESLNYLSPNSD